MNQTDGRKIGPDVESPDYYVEGVYESPFKTVFLAIWRYRGVLIILTGLVTILVLALAGWKYFGQVKENMTRLKFKLVFAGIDKSEYPNGLKFSSSDITAPVVLEKIYRENQLDRYLKYPAFQAALFVIQSNDRLIWLEKEYAEKLSVKNLRAPDRERIEEEFQVKKESLLLPIYTLGFITSSEINSMPFELKAKVLYGILSTWADYAVKVKGVDLYQVALVSPNILDQEDMDKEDYLIWNDMLRQTIFRIKENIARLEIVPGAKLIKVGKDRVSLSDISYKMDDLERFKLSPLVGLIRQSGISKDQALTLSYLENRTFHLKLDKEEAVAREEVYEKSVDQYMKKASEVQGVLSSGMAVSSVMPEQKSSMPAMIPQFGESFLNRLMAMAEKSSDIQFRQEITHKIIEEGLKEVEINFELKYYMGIYNITKDQRGPGSSSKLADLALKKVSSGHEEIYREIIQVINDLNAIYLELSKLNLNPDSLLFTIIEPTSSSMLSSINNKKLILYTIFSWIILEVLIIFGIYLKSLASDKKLSASGATS